jgi:SPX domain protein involved in polyphosphate accumulation
VGKRSIATIGRENVKTPNINTNKKHLLQVDSSKVSGIRKLYEDTTTKDYKRLATAVAEIRNFIRRLAIHPAIRASYNAFLFG